MHIAFRIELMEIIIIVILISALPCFSLSVRFLVQCVLVSIEGLIAMGFYVHQWKL